MTKQDFLTALKTHVFIPITEQVVYVNSQQLEDIQTWAAMPEKSDFDYRWDYINYEIRNDEVIQKIRKEIEEEKIRK